jgi:hypothetical protein
MLGYSIAECFRVIDDLEGRGHSIIEVGTAFV